MCFYIHFCSFVTDALSDSKACLSSSIPTLNTRMTQHLTERSCRFLKSASEVPRLYRRTNKVCEAQHAHKRPSPTVFIIEHNNPPGGKTASSLCLIWTKLEDYIFWSGTYIFIWWKSYFYQSIFSILKYIDWSNLTCMLKHEWYFIFWQYFSS